MELHHRAGAVQELDGVDRLHRVREPEPVQPLVPDPEPAEHPCRDTLAQWRDQYIASNGTLNPATQLVPNPFQPASGPLLPFAGALGAATIARQNTLFPVSAADRVERGRRSHRRDGRLPRHGPSRQPPLCGWPADGHDLHLVQGDRQHRQRGGQPELQRRRRRARQQSQPHRSEAQSTAWLQRRAAPAGRDVPLRSAVRKGPVPGGTVGMVARDRRRLADRWIADLADRLPHCRHRRERWRGADPAGSRRRACRWCCPRTSGAGTTDGHR